MIKNVKDATELFDRRFGAALGRPLSILRTLVWVVLGLYLIGLVFPAPKVAFNNTTHNKQLRGTVVRDVILDKNDPRGWKHLKKDPNKFTIAWIGTSTMQTVRPYHHGYVTVDVTKRLPKIDGKPVQVNMYLFDAGRTFDAYAATEDALKTKPDLVLVDLNAVWLFAERAIQGWPNLNSAALPALISDPANWPLVAAMDSPSDAALALAAGHLSSIRDRWSYAQKATSLINRLAPNQPKIDPSAPAPKLSGLGLIASYQSPLNFWDRYRRQAPKGSSALRQQEGFLLEADTDGSGLTNAIISQMLASLADSKIPSIVYLSAVNPASFKDPGVNSALHRVEVRLRQLADEHRAKTLFVQPQSAIRTVKGLRFKDMVHTTYDPPLVDYLVKMVCSDLNTLNPSGDCSPLPTKAVR